MKSRLFLLVLLVGFSCKRSSVTTIVIKGSDTEINVVLEIAEAFMEQDSLASITITGGGSGVGITALFNGRCDIALSSRPLNPYEKALIMREKIDIVTNIFATDAIAIICHPDAGVTQLTLTELGQIYAGEISNWNEVGGNNKLISLYGRQSNSGTFSYFREHIVKHDFAKEVKEMSGTAQIVEAVKSDPSGIGYVGLGYIIDSNGKLYDGINVIGLRSTDTSKAISPLNRAEVLCGNYPITRPLYQFTIGEPKGKIRDFINFERGAVGQRIIENNGFLPAQINETNE